MKPHGLFVDASIDRIRAYRAALGLSKSALARAAGLPESTLREFDRPSWSPTATTLRKLEALIPPGWSWSKAHA